MLMAMNIILWGIFSFGVMILLMKETNKRIADSQSSSNEELILDKKYMYCRNNKILIVMVLIAILSGIVGFVAALHVSELALIELGMCYMATLGAAVVDIRIKIIPNIIPILLFVSRLIIFIYELLFTSEAVGYLVSSLIGCFLCVVCLLIADKASKGGIGKGDIKLLAAIGFMCGLYVVFSTLLIALLVCIVVGVILLLMKKKESKDHVPFGPFIYIGYVMVILLTLY